MRARSPYRLPLCEHWASLCGAGHPTHLPTLHTTGLCSQEPACACTGWLEDTVLSLVANSEMGGTQALHRRPCPLCPLLGHIPRYLMTSLLQHCKRGGSRTRRGRPAATDMP